MKSIIVIWINIIIKKIIHNVIQTYWKISNFRYPEFS